MALSACGQGGEQIFAKDVVAPPRGEASADYIEKAKALRINTELTYAETVTDIRPQREVTSVSTRSVPTINPNIFVVIAVIVILLIVLLKFGGTGTLLSRDPETQKRKTKAPENWHVQDGLEPDDRLKLLNRLASMQDYRAGLVELLRYCLLFAAEQSDTILARSDTEREAYARVPQDWRKKPELGQLLRQTELVHYGGRDIEQSSYDRMIALGRDLLMAEGGAK